MGHTTPIDPIKIPETFMARARLHSDYFIWEILLYLLARTYSDVVETGKS
jgi:hypothetical protein